MEPQNDLDPQEALTHAPDVKTDVEHEPIEDDTEAADNAAPFDEEEGW